jgi:glycosyltransferase involved in cell wall biosynthesis
MRVTVSVKGRFHAFNLAHQLYKRGHLRRLITTYPKFETAKYGIPRPHIISHLPIEIVSRLWCLTPSWLRKQCNAQFLFHNWTDRLASRSIPDDTNLFVGWSSMSLLSLRKARSLGAITVLERGSSHMKYQTNILREEYEKFGLQFRDTHPAVYEQEIQEYAEADYISIPSSFVKGTFQSQGVDEKKLIQIPYGVSLLEFPVMPKDSNKFRVIQCGALSLRKGIHYLLEAFSELNLPNTELWLIGHMQEEARPFLRKYDNGHVFHKGPYPQRELYRYYSQGSVFCLTSVEEGLAMVIPQAMACGLPIICTTNTGGEDIVRDGIDGFIIPIRDVKSLKEKLVLLYENEGLRKAMGNSARARVSSTFTWDHYGERMIESYFKLLESAGKAF